MWAAPFDANRLELAGQPSPVLEGVQTNIEQIGRFALGGDGSLVYLPGTSGAGDSRTLVWVDRAGREEPLAAEPRFYQSPQISPDGGRVAVVVGEYTSGDIWIYDLARDTPTRLTRDPGMELYPLWTPDGGHLVYSSNREGETRNLYWRPADGTGQAERLTTSPLTQSPWTWAAAGRTLVFQEGIPASPQWDIHVLSMDGDRTSAVLLGEEYMEFGAAISPDGEWIAYQSNESGQNEVYVRPFPNVNEGKWQLSRDGGILPQWSPDGRELFYFNRSDGAMWVVPVETAPSFRPGNADILFEGQYEIAVGAPSYDVSPDGDRFLMVKAAASTEDASAPTQFILVQNWHEELKRLVPVD